MTCQREIANISVALKKTLHERKEKMEQYITCKMFMSVRSKDICFIKENLKAEILNTNTHTTVFGGYLKYILQF
jgi:hypothetical protein